MATTTPATAAASVTGPAAPATGTRLLGFLRVAPRISRTNAWTFLYLNLMIMPIVSFLSFAQPYVLKEIVGIPEAEHGRITGFLVTMQEIVALCLVGFVGGLSDRFGRRPIYALGVFIAGLGFALYGTAGSELDLYIYRFIYAIGVALAGIMIAVTAADYPAEDCRGKLAGATGLLNGLGVALGILALSALPALFQARGFTTAEAGRYMLFVMAGLAIITAFIMQLGLVGGTPTGKVRKTSLVQTARIGIAEGARNPRLLVCYAGAFVSRADLTLIAVFVSLWLQRAAANEGLDGPAALQKAGIMVAIIQTSSLLCAGRRLPAGPLLSADLRGGRPAAGGLRVHAARTAGQPVHAGRLRRRRAGGHGADELHPVDHRPAGPGVAHRRARLGDRAGRILWRPRHPRHQLHRRLPVRPRRHLGAHRADRCRQPAGLRRGTAGLAADRASGPLRTHRGPRIRAGRGLPLTSASAPGTTAAC
jgi:MFS family permease